MRSIRSWLEAVVVWVLLCSCLPGAAQIALKPSEGAAVPLQTRALSAEIVIDQQFAVTRLTQTFRNQSEERTEADFLYTLQPDTIVTSFAYWYGEEKVTAYIVEKEEAAAIYAHITSRMHDPALVEMVGKNAFRARIFPVMPLSDLKVEMTLMQALPSNPSGVSYRLPLRMEKGQSLDTLSVHAEIRKDADLTKVADSFGLPLTEDKDCYRLTLKSKRFRPVSDLRISLYRKPQALRTALVTSPSGGAGGYFALALTPAETLEKPQAQLQGAKLTSLSTPMPRLLPAHQSVYLFGRYTGDDTATVTLSGVVRHQPWSASASLALKTTRSGSGVARQLWAARKIAVVSAGPARNRATVIALSKTYGLPSKYASWLAIPREESENYWREIRQAQLQDTLEQLSALTTTGRTSARTERALYARLKKLCGKLGDESGWIVEKTMLTIAEELLQERNGGKYLDYVLKGQYYEPVIVDKPGRRANPARLASLSRQLNMIAKMTGESAERALSEVELFWDDARSWQARDTLFKEESKDHPDAARVHALEERFIALAEGNGGHEFAVNRANTLAARADLARTERLLDLPATKADAKLTAELQQKKQALSQRAHELNARVGDPLIQVEAPEDAAQVVAVMPDGEIKRLEFNRDSGRWEARFDIPTYASEGDYRIRILIVGRDGARRSLTFPYHVLLTAPSGRGLAQPLASSSTALRLEVEASENAARVSALLPWGEKAELSPTADPHRFLTSAAVPEAFRNRPFAVTFIITDKAHNRTEIRLDPTR